MPRTGRPRKYQWEIRQCERCGKQFEVAYWDKRRGPFCSRQCWRLAQSGRPKPALRRPILERVCLGCGKLFHGHTRRSAYCSRLCAQARGRYAKIMSDVEAAWLAGLFDGEGSVMFFDRSKGRNEPTVRIAIGNTVKLLLERVVEITGVGKVTMGGRPQKSNHTQSWLWAAHGDNARSLLRQILPRLIVKKGKALKALEQT